MVLIVTSQTTIVTSQQRRRQKSSPIQVRRNLKIIPASFCAVWKTSTETAASSAQQTPAGIRPDQLCTSVHAFLERVVKAPLKMDSTGLEDLDIYVGEGRGCCCSISGMGQTQTSSINIALFSQRKSTFRSCSTKWGESSAGQEQRTLPLDLLEMVFIRERFEMPHNFRKPPVPECVRTKRGNQNVKLYVSQILQRL